KGKPVFSQTVIYPRAIPQYNVGYGKYRQLLTDLESALPGLHFAGHYRDGVSLGDSIVSGVKIAEKLVVGS
ncbi:MAG TPA: protoporphyrinogen oxidase, partial [Verrucomicrobiae bacterium]